jgi:hypothetical protein
MARGQCLMFVWVPPFKIYEILQECGVPTGSSLAGIIIDV